MSDTPIDVAIIGAGIGGMASAFLLSHRGYQVEIFDTHARPGGKMRTLPTEAGPVDAGPTVLTMRHIFEALFSDVGKTLSDYVTLIPQERLARHFWDDGTTLDLFADEDRNFSEILRVFGHTSAAEYLGFHERTKLLFETFEEPMMYSAEPDQKQLTGLVFKQPKLLGAMAPHMTLAKQLAKDFSEPRLAQLFGRYATYVGGSPFASPALLSLIWQAEASGVWQVEGGMFELATVLKTLSEAAGAEFHMGEHVENISVDGDSVSGITLKDGHEVKAKAVLFNGDPAALSDGLLGEKLTKVVAKSAVAPRSFSANVWSFSAVPSRKDLGLHNVFFGSNPTDEFKGIEKGRPQTDPTLYVYAQDRGGKVKPDHEERFEIIMNAPPSEGLEMSQREYDQCETATFSMLKRMGLTFTGGKKTLTTPGTFNRLFPGSRGSLYGRSPHGMMSAFKRPTARTKIKGLYLAGGGTHPGAGIPMATLSGMHAAEAIMTDQTLT